CAGLPVGGGLPHPRLRHRLSGAPLREAMLDAPPPPPVFDHFRVEWERAAWQNAGDQKGEAVAKKALLRWRTHSLLGELTGDPGHLRAAAETRPDLPTGRAALGCALARAGQLGVAAVHLRRAHQADPF